MSRERERIKIDSRSGGGGWNRRPVMDSWWSPLAGIISLTFSIYIYYLHLYTCYFFLILPPLYHSLFSIWRPFSSSFLWSRFGSTSHQLAWMRVASVQLCASIKWFKSRAFPAFQLHTRPYPIADNKERTDLAVYKYTIYIYTGIRDLYVLCIWTPHT